LQKEKKCKSMKRLILYILLISLCLPLCAQKHITGKTDKNAYMLGDRIFYSFSIPKTPTRLIFNTPYRFSDTLTLISKTIDSNSTQTKYNFVFTSFAQGDIILPKYYLYEQNSSQAIYEINPPTIKVNYPIVDTVNIDVKALKPIQKVPVTFMEVVTIGIITIGIIALILIIVYVIKRIKKRRTKKQNQKSVHTITLDPEDTEALKALYTLNNANYIANNQIKQHYILLTDIVWRYIFRRFDIEAFEMTSRQIIEALQTKKISMEDTKRIRSIFEIADLVKFAKYQPSISENTFVMQQAKDFVISNGRAITDNEDLIKEEKQEDKP